MMTINVSAAATKLNWSCNFHSHSGSWLSGAVNGGTPLFSQRFFIGKLPGKDANPVHGTEESAQKSAFQLEYSE